MTNTKPLSTRGVLYQEHVPLASAIAAELSPHATTSEVFSHLLQFHGERALRALKLLKQDEVATEHPTKPTHPLSLVAPKPNIVDLSVPINF
ncbi:hypothetical protein [Chamaesiphon sp.]|uniref:hypothetical protein n=1 Tax=Chamaesiphon sp. TaxID=2814140 RepID=UPI0035933D3D